MTKFKLALAAAAVGFVTFTAGQTSAETTVPMTPLPAIVHGSQADSGLFTQVQYGRCHHWRRECADRWGWQTRRWYWCVRRHDC